MSLLNIRALDTLSERLLCKNCSAPFENGLRSKRKVFVPFRVDPFSEGSRWTGTQTGSHKSRLCKTTLRKHAYSNILKILLPKIKKKSVKKILICFIFLRKT